MKMKDSEAKSKKIIQKKHQRKRLDISFAHIRIAIVIFLLSIVALAGAVILDINNNSFWSSILANIFAGLITGLVLCIISGTKQRTIAELKNELYFLNELHDLILTYINLHGEMMRQSFEWNEDPDIPGKFVYDVCVAANDPNSYISQGRFREMLSFEPCEYCLKNFGYNVDTMLEVCLDLRNTISNETINNATKKAIINQFKAVDFPLRKLNSSVLNRAKIIEIKLESMEHSLL